MGYAKLVNGSNKDVAFAVGHSLLDQAKRQSREAIKGGYSVKWVVAEKDFAKTLEGLFKKWDLPISVVHQPIKF